MLYGDFAICLTAIHLHPVCNCTLSIYRNKEQNNTEHYISEQYLRPWSRCDLAISPWCPQVHPRVMYCPSASPVSPDVTWARQTRASSSPCVPPLAASPRLVSWGASAPTLCFLCCILNCSGKSHEVPFGPGGILLVGLWWLPETEVCVSEQLEMSDCLILHFDATGYVQILPLFNFVTPSLLQLKIL